jgi:signal transduction histidine kinase
MASMEPPKLVAASDESSVVPGKRLRRLVIVLGSCIAGIGILTLVGWFVRSDRLVQGFLGWPPMHFNTAVTFLVAAAALILGALSRWRLVPLLGIVAGAMGAAVLAEYALGLNFGIDEALFVHPDAVKGLYPGRMPSATALFFVLVGLALVLLRRLPAVRWQLITLSILGGITLAGGAMAVLVYLIDLDVENTWWGLARTSVPGGISFMLLGGGLILMTGILALESGLDWRYPVPVATCFCGGLLTIAMSQVAYMHEERLLKMRFEADAVEIVRSIEREVVSNLEDLHFIAAFFASSDHVTEHEFQTFASFSVPRHKSIRAVEWVPRVPDSRRKEFEAEAEIGRHSGYAIRQLDDQGDLVLATRRQEYFPIRYVEPRDSNHSQLGFDHASETLRWQAMMKARDSGEPVTLRRLDRLLKRGTDDRRLGFLTFLPIYQQRTGVTSVEQRREHLLGFVSGVFIISEIVEAALGHFHEEGIRLQISGAAVGSARDIGFVLGAPPRRVVLETSTEEWLEDSRGLVHHSVLRAEGQEWKLHCAPTPSYVQSHSSRAYIWILMAGFLFTGLVLMDVIRLSGRVARDEHLVAQRTRELRHAYEGLEREILQRQQNELMIGAKNRDLETLLHVTSHDLKEPLRGIENFSRLVLDRYAAVVDEKGRDFLRRIVAATERLNRLLDDILMLSRAQRADRSDSYVEGAYLVREALQRLEDRIQQTHARVTIETDLPALRVNKTWATQAIYNLLVNALKFTKEGEAPEITIAAYRPRPGEGNVHGLKVMDRGPGVPPEYSERIFQLFQRAVGREIEGTGAGLAIVRQVAERHGGSARVKQRVGGGSVFIITFEASSVPAPTPAVPSGAGQAPVQEAAVLQL